MNIILPIIILLLIYVYKHPNMFDLDSNCVKISMVLFIFFIYYNVLTPQNIFEGFSQGDCLNDENKCKKLEQNKCLAPCKWAGDNKCVADASSNKCSSIDKEDACKQAPLCKVKSADKEEDKKKDKKKDTKCIGPPPEGSKTCYGAWCYLGYDCDERGCAMNVKKDICSKDTFTKCHVDKSIFKTCEAGNKNKDKCEERKDINTICSKNKDNKAKTGCNATGFCTWANGKCGKKTNACKDKSKTDCGQLKGCNFIDPDVCKQEQMCNQLSGTNCKNGCVLKSYNYQLNPDGVCKGGKCTQDSCCVQKQASKSCPSKVSGTNTIDDLALVSINASKVKTCKNKYLYSCEEDKWFTEIDKSKLSC